MPRPIEEIDLMEVSRRLWLRSLYGCAQYETFILTSLQEISIDLGFDGELDGDLFETLKAVGVIEFIGTEGGSDLYGINKLTMTRERYEQLKLLKEKQCSTSKNWAMGVAR